MKSTLKKEKAETMSAKEIFEHRLMEKCHEKQLPDLRRLYYPMIAEITEKPVGFWARVKVQLTKQRTIPGVK